MQIEDTLEEWRPSWFARAACKDLPWTMFFLEDTSTRRHRESELKEGIKVCKTCPVRAECLDHALVTNTKYGIFGGYSSRERQMMRRRLSSLRS